MQAALNINKSSNTPDISFDGHGVISARENIYMHINTAENSIRSFKVGTSKSNSLFAIDSDAIVKIGRNEDIILNKGKGNILNGSDIYFKGSGVVSSQDSLYINIDSDNSRSGSLLIGRGSEKNSNQKALFRLREVSVPASERGNGGTSDSTLTKMSLYGNNEERKSSANIFYYTGKDNTNNQYNTGHREELSIMAGKDIVGRDNDSSGVHYYGNNDSQHSGSIGMFTNGKTRFSINKFGRVGVGSK